ncbi:dTDP-glucose 4,6-dehydratase [Clostridium botulinum]|uniref:dTDP-glucose 4,6-dehydratase n=3 Tax=Clostridium botulinum TaxID=1491 RepID=C1FUB7_CLOBJ|nr:dTDP-glucose 4,6-dehydratase [Clostridium botulinum]ACO84147.1 dTDP-glucose 4,6-dehydratase [Clostridium botulinum A2 str. Kyoto]AUN07862.1 dTDP-glucose 4,6-dehydratase [Clostridium botulinum]MBN3365186.1 dTDP-glucose 4,6-dehydratase [Clostridium botulinum]MBN3370620.1 dTDP-glucose 4,6-dehydratase [Clostridium botulinum]MBN3372563.1 dTDP-glucose 4,6-dehydratase [Clostridium botulinum]
MKIYLVTGGAGFIGSNFIIYMLNKYNEEQIKIINLDKLTYAGSLENLKCVENKNNYMFIKGDISDKNLVDNVFKQYDIDYIINFAAESHVDRSIQEPQIFVETNVLGTVNLLNTAKKYWIFNDVFREGKKYLQVSTDEVYGSLGKSGYFTEDTPLDPHSPYSASKASADLIVRSYYDTYKMPINITRCSNNYGPYQFPEKLIPLIINNYLNNKPIPIYGDGKNIRDWLYVEEHCRAIDMIIQNGRMGEIYNIGGYNERENVYIIKYIIEVLNKITRNNKRPNKLIKYVKDRKGHDKRYAIDPSKIENKIKWESQISFEDGILKTVNWYLNNKQWLNKVTSEEYQRYYENMYKGK